MSSSASLTYELRVGTRLLVSLQRYPLPASRAAMVPPRSHGALPMAWVGPRLFAPAPRGEGFWLGLVARRYAGPVSLGVAVDTADGRRVDAVTGEAWPRTSPPEARVFVPPAHAVTGIRREAGGWWCFARDGGFSAAPMEALYLCATPSRFRDDRQAPPFPGGPYRAERRSAGGDSDGAGLAKPAAWDEDKVRCVRIEIVDIDRFERETGRGVGALDPEAPYRGDRLL